MKTNKLKKVISLILSLTLLIGVVQVPFSMSADAEESTDVNTLYDVDENHKSTTTLSGGLTEGTTFTLTGSGRTQIITHESYPIQTLSFDYGYNYSGNSCGEFGVSAEGEIPSGGFEKSEIKSRLVFFYRILTDGNGVQKIRINVKWSDWNEVTIGEFSAAEIRPGDAYWLPNVSNFSFVKVDGHWHLAVDGAVCNNMEANFAYSCLENAVGKDFFENNTSVHLYFGGNNTGTGYFKQLSVASEDGLWESRAVESYRYNYAGKWREYRGQGNTSTVIHSAIPGAAVGSASEGHVVDFTGTDGYAQTTVGYDLKTTTFHVAPVTYEGNTNNLWYYLGFTTNPAAFQYHTAKPGESIELYAASVYGDSYTGAWLSTNNPASEALANVDASVISLGRFGMWRTHNYENETYNAQLHISFVQDTGADGELHWYMQTTVSGYTLVTKSNDVNNDKYLQFDSIIDKPVYFRMGTHGTNTDKSFKMYCKMETTDAAAVETTYQSLDFGDYTVDFENGATLNGTEYACGATVSEVGEYKVQYKEKQVEYKDTDKYEACEDQYCRNLILYRLGDANADNGLDVLDLISLVKYSAGAKKLGAVGLKSADLNLDGEIDNADVVLLRKSLVSDSDIATTGLEDTCKELVDFTVEVESGRDIKVLQLTDPQIIESEDERVPGRVSADNKERWKKENKEEMYKKYFRQIITESQPDLILVTGDLVYGEFDDDGTALEDFVEFMDNFKIPWAPVFGNHENESMKGVDWQCELLENSKYALFKQRKLTGNGNYTVGIRQDGVYKRVFFMLDSNGCANASAESLANGHTKTSYGFGTNQIEWYTKLAEKIRYAEPNVKLSAAFHVQLTVFEKACLKYGFVDKVTSSLDIDKVENKADGDFGYLGQSLASKWDAQENVYYGMKGLGFDSFFVGHTHLNSASIQYNGVRFQFGQKSSTYDDANYKQSDGSYSKDWKNGTPVIGGTSIPINKDGSLGECQIVLYKDATK